MNEIKTISDYCVGCGLCKTKEKAEIRTNTKGYYEVVSGDIDWLRQVCPSEGRQVERFSGTIWGRYEKLFLGWSEDPQVRKQASSGGALTELAAFLLEQKIVDGIIHTQADESDPTKTKSHISVTRDELINRCGSRYAISHPLEIIETLDLSKKYAFIGKPCDVDALTNAFALYPELKDSIILTMSFFCAGLPSFDAQEKLLKALGCEKEKCRSLRYRGDGWPGFATACDDQGKEYKMDYDSSWGKILGRDLMPMCRFCINGIGETADISCADGWYLSENGKPDFSEHEGRNIIFARSKEGLELIEKVSSRRMLHVEEFPDAETVLPKIQFIHEGKRQSAMAKKEAMRLFARPFPKYPNQVIRKYSKTASTVFKLKTFKGTVDRIRKKTI